MKEKFFGLLKDLGAELTEPSAEEKDRLNGLGLNDELKEIFFHKFPEDDMECGDLVLLCAEDMYIENTDAVPGCVLLPMGLFTFCTTFDGDAVCADMREKGHPVYQCSHSLIEEGAEIYFSTPDGMVDLPCDRENVLSISPRLADSLESFMDMLAEDRVETFGVRAMIEMYLEREKSNGT